MLWPLTSANGYIPDVIVNIVVQMQAHMLLVFGTVDLSSVVSGLDCTSHDCTKVQYCSNLEV